ncbi:MAG: SDR family oxidoreductase [Planctomycetota bacterium]|nr:SDR family oxidoreductase [Planctomycetota bacterium]MDA1164849.1 SDR family oxidoreductase [Planctomycetota bacterium]
MRQLIVGCGYLGRRAAALWKAEGDDVFVLTRSEQNATEFRDLGLTPILGDVTEPATLDSLPECDTVLHAVGYDRSAAASKREVYVDGLAHILDRMTGRCGRFIHISSTSVYGQQAGEWVDEDSLCDPATESGEICLAAERLVLDPVEAEASRTWRTVLRLSGIYGPQRLLSRVEALQQGLPLPGPAEAWLNLIHVDDAARAVIACAAVEQPDTVYLVSDDRPVQRGDYYRLLAQLVNAPEPRFDQDAVARHTRGINKRCRNRRLRDELSMTLQFPDIDSGLAHAVNSSANAPPQ